MTIKNFNKKKLKKKLKKSIKIKQIIKFKFYIDKKKVWIKMIFIILKFLIK